MKILKNFKVSFIVLEIFSTVVLLLFMYYISFYINTIENSPFGLNKNYIKISATYLHYPDENTMSKLNLNFKALLSSYKSIVILENPISQGLGLYDPNGYYSNYVIEGEYFDENDFFEHTSNILINKDSYIYECLGAGNKYYSNNEYFNVKGVLSSSNILLNTDHSFVYSLLNSHNLNGNYYFNFTDKELANKIESFLFKNNFETKIIYFNNEKYSFLESFMFLNSQKFVPVMEIGVIIVYLNTYIYFIYLLFEKKKNIYINKLVGGSNTKIYIFFLKKILLNSFIAAVIALLIYNLIFAFLNYHNTVFTSFLTLLITCIVHIFLNCLIFTITFYSNKNCTYGGYSKE